MSDIVPGLRRLPEPQCSPCYAAADEIERLGRLVRLQDAEIERLRLTDEEREAIAEAVGAYNDNDDDEECAKTAATLHGLLKRTDVR
jgi:hypothetical protein